MAGACVCAWLCARVSAGLSVCFCVCLCLYLCECASMFFCGFCVSVCCVRLHGMRGVPELCQCVKFVLLCVDAFRLMTSFG